MSNDVHYEFRQQSDFLYFTGFPEPDSIALIEVGETTKYTLFVPKRDKDFEIWNGRRFGREGAIEIFGADEAFVNSEFEEKIIEIMKRYENVFYPMGENPEFDDKIHQLIINASKSRDKSGTGPIHVTNILYDMHTIRVKKTKAELDLIRESARISAEAMKLGIEVTKTEMIESQVESVIEYYYAKNGAVRPAYPTIAGTGVNATILHYIENNETLKDGQLLLVDAGAEYKGYASDITRTWPVNGKFTKEQKQIYQIVLDTQEACIKATKPGITIKELHDLSTKMITEGLVNVGLLQGEVDQLIEEGAHRRYFMHGIGHYLGMDVHDTSLLGREYELEENYYFTIEPGIYIPDEDDIPEEYRGIGVRIEDDILVTADGNENLTELVPKSIEAIESIIGSKNLP